MASQLEVSERTLRNWKLKYGQDVPPRGRKRSGITLTTMLKIAREWRRQGYPGSRPIVHALKGVPVRRIRETVQALKVRRRKRYELHKENVRVRVKTNRPGIITALDGASPERGEYIVSKDLGDLRVLAIKCEGPVQSTDTMTVLKDLKRRGELPLVYRSDNGSPLCAEVVQEFLRENKVIHLRSLPRVPQHNGSNENAVKEVKTLMDMYGLSSEEACEKLNANRLRQSLNWQTSEQYRRDHFKPISDTEREIFFKTANAAIKQKTFSINSVYERRKAEREAIFQTLEDFKLITRTRGRHSTPLNAERIA